MKIMSDQIMLSASDLANYLGCHHLTALDLSAVKGVINPPVWHDPGFEALKERGLQHEKDYLKHLKEEDLQIVKIPTEEEDAIEATKHAMQEGVDIIAQASLAHGRWYGRADILRRVNQGSDLGDWSYEVIDTKLARETRAGTILQLCLYSDIISEIQGFLPDNMYVVSPGTDFKPEIFRTYDYFSYYRFVQRRLENAVDNEQTITYPDPVPQCDLCHWWSDCDRKRHDDDHLCLVADISKLQQRELQHQGIDTLELLGKTPISSLENPRRGSIEGYKRIREQARIQLEGRCENKPVYELLPREEGRGLSRLPVPSKGDIFFDIEGDPFFEIGGLEYLLGWIVLGEKGELKYHDHWSFRREEERINFETLIDEIMAYWERFPDMHIYHYSPYEPGAIKRLMGRYATREEEVDRMLRAGLFVDLYTIVKQTLRASVEKYSIKNLEQFYHFEREVDLRDASSNLHRLELLLESGKAEEISQEMVDAVKQYNYDDCVSTYHLRNWLETHRAELVEQGEEIGRPEINAGEVPEQVDEWQKRLNNLREKLLQGVPDVKENRSKEQQAHWLLAQMLEWHRREEKTQWWEYFRLVSLNQEELIQERAGLGGLEFVECVGGTDACPIHRYQFIPQDVDIIGNIQNMGGGPIGTNEDYDLNLRIIDIKKRKDTADFHPSAIFFHQRIPTRELKESLFRLGTWVAEYGIDADGSYQAARNLLLMRGPSVLENGASYSQSRDVSVLDVARDIVKKLDEDVLPVQGPPGSGKTYTGARMICELVRTGKKVGITAVSHKVIRNLLDRVVEAGEEEGVSIYCIQKISGQISEDKNQFIKETTTNNDVLDDLEAGRVQVAAGTAWLWARNEFSGKVDFLFVDEASQMSLANVLAVAAAGKNVILLGDPQQLEQPQQGTHPEDVDVSALEHLLGGRKTISPEQGLFLNEIWRLHPSICQFTSELFYENRLDSRPNLERQILQGTNKFDGAGLWFLPVEHEGNQNSSIEEVNYIETIYNLLLRNDVFWIDHGGESHPISQDDVLIVAPYNAQVSALGEKLDGARIGTVDKFQGQEAPVVIYSMATSTPEEAPHGMEFLYSLNRFNVATSRALCTCILVASPNLFELECRTPRQIQLANAFCRYLELARPLDNI